MDMVVLLLMARPHTSVLRIVVALEGVLYSYIAVFASAADVADTGLDFVALYLPFALLGLGGVSVGVSECYHMVSV